MQHASQAALFSLIGDTPLIEVTRIDTGPCQLFLKLESQNPGGSIKDRIGRAMIEQAEHDGHLQPGGTPGRCAAAWAARCEELALVGVWAPGHVKMS